MKPRRSHRAFRALDNGAPTYAVVRAKAELVEAGRPLAIFRVATQTSVTSTGLFLTASGGPELTRFGFYDVAPRGRLDRTTGQFNLARDGRIARAREIARFGSFERAVAALRRMTLAWDGVNPAEVDRLKAEAENYAAGYAKERARLIAEVDIKLKHLADVKNVAAARLVEAKSKVLAERNASLWISEALK